ncbi:hypothetical protein [Gaetbulibacter aestuarii]|uniref:Beta-lactamase-inhibitor-like PepSY-like domain-containing protein n=1 Tax=Gaetbulibacter aestuarii TaxID=1502358 RepID=A0ABW7MUZ7_9FLAO
MKKIILTSLIFSTLICACKAQNSINSSDLTVNDVQILFQDVSKLSSNFGQPQRVLNDYSEMDEKSSLIYEYSGAEFYVMDNKIVSYKLNDKQFSFSRFQIKVGDKIDDIRNLFPDSYHKKNEGSIVIQILNNDLFLGIDYHETTKKILSIGIYSY